MYFFSYLLCTLPDMNTSVNLYPFYLLHHHVHVFSLTLSRMLMAEAIPTMPTPTTVTLFWQPIGCSFITWPISFSLVDICSWGKSRGGPSVCSQRGGQKTCGWCENQRRGRGQGKQDNVDRWDNSCVWGCVRVFGGRARLTKALGNCTGDYLKWWQEVLQKGIASPFIISKSEIFPFSY